jgi:hypothetical protein
MLEYSKFVGFQGWKEGEYQATCSSVGQTANGVALGFAVKPW